MKNTTKLSMFMAGVSLLTLGVTGHAGHGKDDIDDVKGSVKRVVPQTLSITEQKERILLSITSLEEDITGWKGLIQLVNDDLELKEKLQQKSRENEKKWKMFKKLTDEPLENKALEEIKKSPRITEYEKVLLSTDPANLQKKIDENEERLVQLHKQLQELRVENEES